MAQLKRVELAQYATQPFATFRAAPVIVAQSEGRANAMTIGWGGLGTLWSIPVSTTYVRTSRFTHQLMSCSSLYSICWLPESMKDAVALCGKESGRDMDKLAACGLTLAHTEEGVPYVKQSEIVIANRKIHAAPIDMLGFCKDGMHDRWYQPGTANSPHVTFIGEVLGVWQA